MNLDVRTRGRHNLTSMSPMEYCWVASNYASALHKDPDFEPDDNEIMSMLFTGYLDRFHFRIRYSAIRLCCLIFHEDTLLAFRPQNQQDEDDFQLPNMVTARRQTTLGHDASRPHNCIESSVHSALFDWADRIADDKDRLNYAVPSMLYYTIVDPEPVSEQAAEQHVLGVVAGIFQYVTPHQETRPTSTSGKKEVSGVSSTSHDAASSPVLLKNETENLPRPKWNFDACYYNGRIPRGGSHLIGRWLTQKQVEECNWDDDEMRDLAMLAFRAYKGQDVSSHGCEIGKMYID